MDAQTLKLRGKIVDELQERIQVLQKQGKTVPDSYREKIKEIVETQDAELVAAAAEWVATELPPKEYQTEEITWQTFEHWSEFLLERLAIYAIKHWLLSGEAPQDVVDFMREIRAIKDATDSPVVAMAELTKLRAKTLRALKDFRTRE